MNTLYTKAGLERAQTLLRAMAHLRPPDIVRHMPLYTFDSAAAVDAALECSSDARWGGTSHAVLGFAPPNSARFSGELADVQSYAGFQTRPLPRTLFSSRRHKLEAFSHVCMIARLAPRPDNATNDDGGALAPLDVDDDVSGGLRVMFNIKATMFDEYELYQYPLTFTSHDWHRFTIPMRNFVQTQDGLVRKYQNQLLRDYVSWLGLSVSSVPGPFCVDVAEISAVNPPGLSDSEFEDAYREAALRSDKEAMLELDRIRDEYKINL